MSDGDQNGQLSLFDEGDFGKSWEFRRDPLEPRLPPSVPVWTSEAAAESMVLPASGLRKKILDLIRDGGGFTCDEVERIFRIRHQSASARIRELVQDGWIEDSGESRKTRSGRKAIVWKAKE